MDSIQSANGRDPHEPYCGECGYQLTGLTESTKCPECGLPIVEVLVRGEPSGGKRFRTKAKMFGLPIVDIAFGPAKGERMGRAKGIIALGDVATGWLAVGGRAKGLVAVGGLAMGGFAIGGGSIGVLSAWGGAAVGGLANGGLAVGGLASGGGAIGYGASGGLAVGNYAMGGSAIGNYVIGSGGTMPLAVQFFDGMGWFFGGSSPNAATMIQPMVVTVGSILGAALVVGLMAMVGHMRHKDKGEEVFLPPGEK